MTARGLRNALPLGLALLLSGVPQSVSAASTDCCDERCEGSLAGDECPPTCGLGACAKVRPTIDSDSRTVIDAPASPGRSCAQEDHRPVLPVVTSGVFHPPRP